ncbi:MAG: hypothetical protein ACPGUI_00450 [Halarcobacter sp.]
MFGINKLMKIDFLSYLLIKYSNVLRKFKECEFVNDDLHILNTKVLSKTMNTNVTDYAISGDFTTIACWCTDKSIMKFLKMRKYIKADAQNIHAKRLAQFYNIAM